MQQVAVIIQQKEFIMFKQLEVQKQQRLLILIQHVLAF
jgi:hypothetical protein